MTSVAGDFYDFIVANDKQAGLLIADVSGHGVPAALIAIHGQTGCDITTQRGRRSLQFLSRMNSALLGNTKNQFVTAAYVHLDSESQKLRYSAAGHPPMLLLRQGNAQEIEENGLMLAAFDFAKYSNATHRLEQAIDCCSIPMGSSKPQTPQGNSLVRIPCRISCARHPAFRLPRLQIASSPPWDSGLCPRTMT
jgi:Stage II sporulation protein E (SpoIIE)